MEWVGGDTIRIAGLEEVVSEKKSGMKMRR